MSGDLHFLSFDPSGNPECGTSTKTVTVSAGNHTYNYSHGVTGDSGGRAHELQWDYPAFPFVALSPATAVQFASQNGGACGPMLDNVSVMAPPHIHWTDWQSSDGHALLGTMTTSSAAVSVTYNNPQGLYGVQLNGGTDSYRSGHLGRTPGTSPYTSTGVANIPTGTDIVQLRQLPVPRQPGSA